MEQNAMRQYAYDIVYGTMEQDGHSDELFHHILDANTALEPRQRRFLKKLAFGAVERAIEMDARLDAVSRIPAAKMEPELRTVFRMALYEICYMDQVPDAVACHEAVALARKRAGERATGFVNGVLRAYLRKRNQIAVKEIWQQLSLPEELMAHLTDAYGKKTARKIGESFLSQSGGLTLHVDTNKISVEEYTARLEQEGIAWQRGAYWEDAVVLRTSCDVTALPGFTEGWFFVQDESSMLPVACAGIQQGGTVVDVCGAPGGKSLHALLVLAGTGRLLTRDVSEKKVEKIRENIARMGYRNASCKVWDATEPDAGMRGKADVILADVPCSGIGIIGRKPEIKYRALPQQPTLIPLQREICKQSVPLLKPGGVLIYSTCTINQAENEENVRWMEEHLGLVRESLNPYLPEMLRNRMTEEGMLQMLPGIQKSDGFFVARLRR